jgi:hypothetical protein
MELGTQHHLCHHLQLPVTQSSVKVVPSELKKETETIYLLFPTGLSFGPGSFFSSVLIIDNLPEQSSVGLVLLL